MKKTSLKILVKTYCFIVWSVFILFISPMESKSQNLLNKPESVDFDSLNNRYLVSNYGDGSIIQIDSNGTHNYFKTGLGRCLGNHIDGNVLYVSVKEYSGVPGGIAVLGIDLSTAQIVSTVAISSALNLDGLASDTSGYLYVIDTYGKIFKITISNQSYSLYVNSGLAAYPQDCIFDKENNRLIVVAGASYAPIQSVSLEDSTISTVVIPPFGSMDGITNDQFGNTYVATHQGGCIYRYDSVFNSPPQLISSGHNGPAGPHYNTRDNILAIPNFYSNTIDFVFVPPVSVKKIENELPQSFDLKQNYPNPFNPITTIQYDLSKKSNVILIIYDILGQKVRTLVEEKQKAGRKSVVWDGRDNNEITVGSGVYIYSLKTEDNVQSKKMIFIK